MPLSNYQKQVRHRAKVKLKLARLERYEQALREIADMYQGLDIAHASMRARNALTAEAEA